MLDSIITSKMRIKLLLKFFLNTETRAYLQELAAEFGASSNGIRVELNRLTAAKLLLTENSGRTILYRANTGHMLFQDIRNVVHKYVGIDRLAEDLVAELGQVKAAYITGDYARGVDSGLIDLVLVGQVNRNSLRQMIEKTSRLINRKIRPLVLDEKEFQQLRERLDIDHALPVWGNKQVLLTEELTGS